MTGPRMRMCVCVCVCVCDSVCADDVRCRLRHLVNVRPLEPKDFGFRCECRLLAVLQRLHRHCRSWFGLELKRVAVEKAHLRVEHDVHQLLAVCRVRARVLEVDHILGVNHSAGLGLGDLWVGKTGCRVSSGVRTRGLRCTLAHSHSQLDHTLQFYSRRKIEIPSPPDSP
jgi:hypothetical protein